MTKKKKKQTLTVKKRSNVRENVAGNNMEICYRVTGDNLQLAGLANFAGRLMNIYGATNFNASRNENHAALLSRGTDFSIRCVRRSLSSSAFRSGKQRKGSEDSGSSKEEDDASHVRECTGTKRTLCTLETRCSLMLNGPS